MLVHRAVRPGEKALIAAGSHHKGVRQAQGTGVSFRIPRILDGHVPGLALGRHAVNVHIAAQAHKAAGNAASGKQLRRLIRGVALGDAAQIDGAALIQRGGSALQMDMLRAHQRQQRVNLRLGGDAGIVAGDAPQLYQRGDGHVEGTAGLGAVLQRRLQQCRRVIVQLGDAIGVQLGYAAGFDGAAQPLFQRVDLVGARLQYIGRAVADGYQRHIGVHGENVQRFGFRCAAAGEGQERQAAEQQTDQPLHSSRRPLPPDPAGT